MRKNLLLNLGKQYKKALSAVLVFAIVLSLVVMPASVPAFAAFLDERTFTFDEGSGTVYDTESRVEDESGADRQVAGNGFSAVQADDNGVLSLTDSRMERNANNSWFVLNDASGLYQLKADSAYTVTLKLQVVSNHVTFEYNKVTYPLTSQKSFVNLVYGMASSDGSLTSTPVEVGNLANLTTGATTFTRTNAEGATENLAFGQWHELTFTFNTPAEFTDDNALGFVVRTFNGADIQIDDVYVARVPSVTLVTSKGTLSQTVVPAVIGEKIVLPSPTYSTFGTDFSGWYLDSACTKPFTDEYFTPENCELTLYAGWSNEHFTFDSYTPSHERFGFSYHFCSIVEDPEKAYSSNKYLYYHYTEEYWSQVYSTNADTGAVTYFSSRRTGLENCVSLTYVESFTDYVITLKYLIPEGSGDMTVFAATGSNNIWHENTYKAFSETETVLASTSGEWKEHRIAVTTGDLSKVNGLHTDIMFLRFQATNHRHTEMYLDEITLEKVEGDTTLVLNANGGEFADGSSQLVKDVSVGDSILNYERPTRTEYDFKGWAYDKNGVNMVETNAVDTSLFRNTLYAVWSRDMGFEGYYYDLESENRNNYISDTVSIVKGNAQAGEYSAKLNDTAGGKQNVIALNPVNNNKRYLATFYYNLEKASSDIQVKFATMNYNINNSADVNIYGNTYTIPAADAGKGYMMGAVIIETAFKNANSNRLAMLLSSESGAYTVYIDTVELTEISDGDGYVIYSDLITGEFSAGIGKLNTAVVPDELSNRTNKFMGWYTDEALNNVYGGEYKYSESFKRIYASWILGQGFENYTPVSSNVAVTVDSSNKNNKYITVNGTASEKVYTTVSGKRYGVELRYSVTGCTESTAVSFADGSFTVTDADVNAGWKKAYMVVTANGTGLNLQTAGNDSFTILIDDLIIYEITDKMSIVTFDQKDGYGEDSVRVGAAGTIIEMPESVSHATDAFYGWYLDSALQNPFISGVFPENDTTLYARWASNPVTKVSFDNYADYENLPFTENNSFRAYVTNKAARNSTYSLAIDRILNEDHENYIPLANENGFVTLESNTSYAISYYYYFPSYTSSATLKFNFYASSGETYTKGNALAGAKEVKYATGWKSGCAYFTTGDLAEGENVLYLHVLSGTKKSMFYMDGITITRIDQGRNHVFFTDSKNQGYIHEVDGNYGEKIDYPEIDTKNYEVEGWYTDFETLNHHSSGTHNSEPATELFCRWDIKTITFDNYEFEGSNSKYTVGDDISLSFDEAYDTSRSLKYSYNYAIKYFETSNNVAGLGRVVDDSTYRISFRYKITEAQGDVDIKFLTAHLTNRWAYITDYDKATYTVYSSEIGDDWKKATVYLTTDFASIATSGLFMTFNPVVEGDTVLYIDTVEVEYMRAGSAVTAFIGKNGNAEFYTEGNEGDVVSAPDTIPASQFSAFEGWYSDQALTEEFSSLTAESGINYVYSAWTEKAEKFDNYTYASNDEANFAYGNKIADGVLTYTAAGANKAVANGFRIGNISNNTSYKLTFDYKTASSDVTVKLATADEMNIGVNTTEYADSGNYVGATADGEWHSATLYFTSSFAYTVPKDEFVNAAENKNADYGDMLYMYFENNSGAVISIDNIVLTEVEALYSDGVSVLTEQASAQAESQALRFYFSYATTNTSTVYIGGVPMGVVERGIIFKNARNTATGTDNGDTIAVKALTLSAKNDPGHTYISKSSGLNQYWKYDNKNERLVYSGYVNNFNLNDSRLMGARGYIKVKDELGNIYTFYSADKKTTVKEGVELNSEITDTKVHTFAGITWDNFKIVNPKRMPYIYGRQIEFLIDYAKQTHNVVLNRYNERAAENEYEIVIGDTTRDASDLVTVENENEYVIAMRGTKLIIKGGSDLATMQGVKDFIAYLKLKDSLGCGADIKDGYTKTGTISTTGDDYALTFNDDFDASVIDASVWGCYNNQSKANNYTTVSQFDGIINTYSVNEGGYTTASGRVVEDAVGVRDGNLVLTTARVNDTDFTKGEVSTFWNMIYQYGYIEINCKLGEPPSHVGWWMNGAATGSSSFVNRFGRESRGCMTEYDLLENYGRMDYYASAIHHWWSSTSVKDNGHVSLADSYGIGTKAQTYVREEGEENMYGDYHIFTFLWENDRLIYAFDGVKYHEYINYDYYKDRMPNYIILSAGMAGRDYGVAYDIEKHSDYYESLVDYVRIYQQKNMGSILRYAQ